MSSPAQLSRRQTDPLRKQRRQSDLPENPQELARRLELLSAKVATCALELKQATLLSNDKALMARAMGHLHEVYETLQQAIERDRARWSRA